VSSTGNSVADVSNSAGNLINRSPEAQVGVSGYVVANEQRRRSLTSIDRPAQATFSQVLHRVPTLSSPVVPTTP